jgi:hypothetical protein
MTSLIIPRNDIISMSITNFNELRIKLNKHLSNDVNENDTNVFKISNRIIDTYLYMATYKELIITLVINNGIDIHKLKISTPTKSLLHMNCRRKMSDLKDILKNCQFIRYVYKNKIYYGLYDGKLINGSYRSLSGFVKSVSDGRSVNGWNNCEMMNDDGYWIKF